MNLSVILLTVSAIWGIAVITPGPNFLITVHVAISGSRRSALFVVLGITGGTCIWSIAGFWGINMLFHAVPFIYYFIKIMGGCYLIYLGTKLLKSKVTQKSKGNCVDVPSYGLFRYFKLGLFTNLSNPKTAAFVTSLFAATMPADASIYLGFVNLILMCSISVAWYSLVAYVFSYNRSKTLYLKFKRYIERIAGTIFIVFGVKLAASG